MNILNTIIFAGGIHALYLAFFIFTKRKKTLSDNLLISLFLLFFIVYITGFLAYNYQFDLLILSFLPNVSLLIPPLLFIYFSSLMEENFILDQKHLFHFIPFLVSFIFIAFHIYIYKPDIKILEMPYSFNFHEQPIHLLIYSLTRLIYTPIYLAWLFLKFRKHKLEIKNNFSYSEEVNLNWIKNLLIFICGAYSSYFMIYFLFSKVDGIDSGQVGFACSSLFIFYIGFYGFKQRAIYFSQRPEILIRQSIENNSSSPEKKERYIKSKLSQNVAQLHMENLKRIVEKEKLYLNHKFTLNELSDKSGIPHHNISQILNEHLDKNFYNFINEYRIQEFKEQVLNPKNKNYSILAIAFDCGFNSKSSFNRIFKEMTGQTPSQYIDSTNNNSFGMNNN